MSILPSLYSSNLDLNDNNVRSIEPVAPIKVKEEIPLVSVEIERRKKGEERRGDK